jgi:DNA-binding response OmpR family regulator
MKIAKKKIMVIDDNKEFLEELQELLNLTGYDTVVFSDGASALKMVSKIKPDVILLDLKLGKKSGFHVASKLKRFRKTANIPIIGITGFYVEKEQAKLMNTVGVKTFLIKPFESSEVIAKIKAVLR